MVRRGREEQVMRREEGEVKRIPPYSCICSYEQERDKGRLLNTAVKEQGGTPPHIWLLLLPQSLHHVCKCYITTLGLTLSATANSA